MLDDPLQSSAVAIDILQKEGDTLDKSNKALTEIEDSAVSALRTLGQQNQTLKVQRDGGFLWIDSIVTVTSSFFFRICTGECLIWRRR